MKFTQWIYHYINNTGTQQMRPKLSIPVLLAGLLLSLLFAGCGAISFSKGAYEVPKSPKSELATVKIDTEGGWLHRYSLIVFRIDGKLAVREEIKMDEAVSIDEILVAPGKHDMSVTTIHTIFHGDKRETVQTVSRFSADVTAGNTYLLNKEKKLVDVDIDKVVSKSRLPSLLEFNME